MHDSPSDASEELAPGQVPAPGSVTCWLDLLKVGDPRAAQPLWERYFQRLVRLARAHLGSLPRGAADEEDVALHAFDSFCRDASAGRFPRLDDRSDLWRLLVTLTAQKAVDLARRERAAKRGAGQRARADEAALAAVLSREPTPAFAAQVAEECQRLLGRLDDPSLRTLAGWKMEGFSNEEIAARLGCVPRTVERRLQLIRETWAGEGEA